MEKLVIWITDADASNARWLVLDANGNRAGFPQRGALAEAESLAHGRRVIVLLPGERILAADARVPGNNPRRILQAAPYALEEKLAGDVDALHVALVDRGAEQRCDFLVVERDWFTDMLETLSAAGIHADATWPDYLAIPDALESERWILLEDGRLLAKHGWHGFAAAAADAAFLLGRRNEDAPLRVTAVGDQALPGALTDRVTENLADGERAFTELAATAAQLAGNGLLQGEFRRKRESATNWRRWRWPAVAGAAWLGIALASFGLDIYRLEREHDMLEQATSDLFEQALPGGRRIRGEERYLVEQALGTAGSDSNPLLGYIADVAQVMQTMPKAQLNSFNFRNDYLEFSVIVPNATDLENLRARLSERSGQVVDVQAANSAEGGLEGRLMLGGGGQG